MSEDDDGYEPGWTFKAEGTEVVMVSGCGRFRLAMPVEGAREIADALRLLADAIDADAVDVGAELLGGG